jgi:hypothetical protein
MPEQNKERACVEVLFQQLDAKSCVPFPQVGPLTGVSREQGVYVIRDPANVVVHVGRTVRAANGLLQRLRNHLNGHSSFTRNYLSGNPNELRNGFAFQYIEVPNDRERALLEHFATAWYSPKHLGLGRDE